MEDFMSIPTVSNHKNKTVVRSMDLLHLFLHHEQLTISDMVKLSNMPKTTVHRMIGSLEDMGLLEKDHEGKYKLGLLFLQFGHLVSERLDIRKSALPIMHKLSSDVKEAVHLAIRNGNEAVYIEKLDTDQPVRLFTKIGRKAPLYAGASSRIILAHLEAEEREHYLNTIELKPVGEGTITNKERLRDILNHSREVGYSFSRAELENYTAELGAPIFDYSGKIIAAISIAGLEIKFDEQHLPGLIQKLKQAALEISLQLGFQLSHNGNR